MFSVSFQTFGCKLNQLETESISASFKKEGFLVVPWSDPADIFVVNTCTVTSKAEQKARRVIRKTLKENPAACLIATGCYVQLDPDLLETLSERGRIIAVTGDFKDKLLDLPAYVSDAACTSAELPELLHEWAKQFRPINNTSPITNPGAERFRFDVNDFSFHSRASLKIQDGCNNCCAYCRVRIARGKSCSLDAPTILARLQELERRSYGEAVLTGININQYQYGSMNLPALLRYLLEGTEKIALRISSTEPDAVNEDFIQAISHERIRPHFHLSVQSGSDHILSRMRRHYRSEQVLNAVRLLRSVKKDPFIACDIIAGFPGETNEDFEQTFELCTEAKFAWIHAFPFSPRPGTEAVKLDGHVHETIARERVDRLIALACSGRNEYLDEWKGRTVSAIVEQSSAAVLSQLEKAGCFHAVSENYIKLAVQAGSSIQAIPGSTIRCRIENIIDDPENRLHSDAIAVILDP